MTDQVGPSSDAPGEKTDGILLRRYGLILALILFGFVLTGVEPRPLAPGLNAAIWGLVLLVALWAPGLPRLLRSVGLGATLVVMAGVFSLGALESATAGGWRAITLAVAQIAAMLAILSRVVSHERVSLQTVMGGIAAYGLIAFAMASLYFGLDSLIEEAVFDGLVDDGDYTYFSFITLTTLGFGDITPASALVKRLVVLEAFVGQVFIITFLARLVSLWGQPLRARRD
jgi:hypothetical protein